ncbi:hypothetical protein BGW38_002868, partial [Lunasporangiospora selenospora]
MKVLSIASAILFVTLAAVQAAPLPSNNNEVTNTGTSKIRVSPSKRSNGKDAINIVVKDNKVDAYVPVDTQVKDVNILS